MNKLKKAFISAPLVFLMITPVMAQSTTPTRTDRLEHFKAARDEARSDFRAQTGQVRDDLKLKREEGMNDLKVTRDAHRDELEAMRADGNKDDLRMKRDEFINDINQRRRDFHDELQIRREETRDALEMHRAEFRDRLQLIHDERKKEAITRVEDKAYELVGRLLNHFTDALERLEGVLNRISSRAEKAEANDHDISAVDTAIVEAQNAIAAARDAVAELTGKTYEFDFADETQLRQAAQRVRQAIHDDLTKVRELVRVAHDAVRRAAVALAQIPRVDDLEIVSDDGSDDSNPEE